VTGERIPSSKPTAGPPVNAAGLLALAGSSGPASQAVSWRRQARPLRRLPLRDSAEAGYPGTSPFADRNHGDDAALNNCRVSLTRALKTLGKAQQNQQPRHVTPKGMSRYGTLKTLGESHRRRDQSTDAAEKRRRADDAPLESQDNSEEAVMTAGMKGLEAGHLSEAHYLGPR